MKPSLSRERTSRMIPTVIASAEVKAALDNYAKVLTYTNTDSASLSWQDASQLVINGDAAFNVMGDWAEGYFKTLGNTPDVEFGYVPSPGTAGSFLMLSDSFGLPKGVKHPENAKLWLALCGSKEGQEAFNPKKGSICARTDCDPALFNEYLKSAMQDWSKDAIVPSVAHGAAAVEKWAPVYKDILNTFATKGDVAATQTALQQACVDNGVCK